jgi:hypothetical protein
MILKKKQFNEINKIETHSLSFSKLTLSRYKFHATIEVIIYIDLEEF